MRVFFVGGGEGLGEVGESGDGEDGVEDAAGFRQVEIAAGAGGRGLGQGGVAEGARDHDWWSRPGASTAKVTFLGICRWQTSGASR